MATPKWIRVEGRERRHLRIKKKIFGTSSRPRLCVRRSLNHTYAQLIDEEVSRLLKEAYERSKKLLALHAERIERVVAALLEQETLEREEFEALAA